MEEDLGSPIADNVATNVTANITPFKFLSSQLGQIRKRRFEVAKRLKNIRIKIFN